MKTIQATPLPHFNERPVGTTIDTIVIHSMYSTEGSDLFSPERCIELLNQHTVAAHYLIARDGTIFQMVNDECRAWHAGRSCMPFPDDLRVGVNDFSIGVELIASETSGFSDAQYESLTELTHHLTSLHPISTVVGHDQIAPDRKTDPGPLFDWSRYRTLVSRPDLRFGA